METSMGERACRFRACFSRRGLFWVCFSPASDGENCDTTEGAPHERVHLTRSRGVHNRSGAQA
eukprot:scaffold89242_cov30-Phaeocystis_antarctica.AAC.1